MSGLPDTRFYLDDGTGTFPINITSFMRLVEGYSFTRGRADTESGPTSGTMNAEINNGMKGAVGAFTPGSTLLHTPSVIGLDCRIRCTEKVNGTTYNRYTGYVKSWAVGWPNATENTGVVSIQCSDAQERAERRILRSVVEEEIMADSPAAYYTLGEPAGAVSAGDTSGSGQNPAALTGSGSAMVFGTATGPATDSLTGATFANGQYLSTVLAFASTPTTLGIGFFFTASANTPILRITPLNPSGPAPIIDVGGSGHLRVVDQFGTFIQNAVTTVNDGALHHGFVVLTATTITIYVDGSTTGAVANTSAQFAQTMLLEIGGANFVPNNTYGTTVVTGPGMTGSLEHVSIFTTAPSAARVLSEATAGLTGFAGESDNARITRLAGYANIPVGTLDTSLTNVPFIDFGDGNTSAWAAIQQIADASMGVAYIDGSGNLAFHNRQKVTTKTTPDLTLSSAFVTFDAEPTTDGQDLLNYMEGTSSVTGVSQIARDTVSEYGDATHQAHGRYPDAKEFAVSTDAEVQDRINWLIKTRSQPSSSGRYGTLTVNLYGMSATQQSSVVQNLEPGCWLRIVNMPTQTTGGTTVDLAVEGIAPNQSGNNWTITCNVVAKSLYPKVFTLDSSLLDGPDPLAV